MIPGNPPAPVETSLERIARSVRTIYEGGVGGPSPAGAVTDNSVVRWDGTDGRTAQGSGVTIDDNGVMRLTGQPSFSANKNSVDQTTITAGVFTKLTFGTEEWDTGGYYDAANSKWTPPAGVAVINAGARMTGGVVDQAIMVVTVYKNGSRYRDLCVQTISGSGAGITPAGVGPIIEQTDGIAYYEIYFIATGAGDKTVSGLTVATFFQGHMLA